MTHPTCSTLGIFVSALILLMLSGCQAVIHEKGTILDPKTVDHIEVGLTSRNEVRMLLGPPTFVNNFREERWIYIQDRQFKNMQRTFSRAANRIEITFDESGTVADMKRNFGDTLLDPTTLPEAQNEQSWFGWLWGGKYIRPATQGVDPTQIPMRHPETEDEEQASGEAAKETNKNRDTGPWDPFWRFWPLEDADNK